MTERTVSISDMSYMHAVFGDFDENINIIQKEYKVSIYSRDEDIRVKGDENAVDKEPEENDLKSGLFRFFIMNVCRCTLS